MSLLPKTAEKNADKNTWRYLPGIFVFKKRNIILF